jgi:predicted amidophosphoribosyltransferase
LTPGSRRAKDLLHRATATIAQAVFPGRCLACGTWMDGEDDPATPVCRRCRARLVPISGPRCPQCGTPLIVEEGRCTRCRTAGYAFASAAAVFTYRGTIRDLIIALKSGGRNRLVRLFAPFLAALLAERYRDIPVVAVPSRPGRSGPDAVGRLCRELERRHGVRVLRLLRRGPGPAQKSLTYSERLRNLRGRIRMARGARAAGALVLLDDVLTTGATLDACARTLLSAGASRVDAVTLAID